MNAATGQALYERNADEGFIPASNRKLFTGALALDQLGSDFHFRTFLYHTGNVGAEGSLNGSLVIIPAGDPTFSRELYSSTSSDWVYRDWAEKVSESGIKSVEGDLLIDCSSWDLNDLSPRGWAERVLQDSYAPQTSPLTLNSNLITVIVNPTEQGAPGKISFAPPATGYPVLNQTTTGKKGRVSIRRTPSGIVASGTVTKAGQGGQIPCDNPTLFAAANFRHHLREKGIHIKGAVRIVGARAQLPGWNNDNLIAVVESPPLLDIVKHMMKKSDNHMAEQLYVAISAHKLQRGSYSASRQLEDDLLRRAGIDPRGVQAFDGSGLSEANRVTPSQVCSLLNYMMTHPEAQNYYASMAIGGVDGTLRNRMNSSKLKARVHAKTGTINKVSTLSGYFRLSEQQMLTFSFLVNNIRGGSVRGSQDRIISIMSSLVL